MNTLAPENAPFETDTGQEPFSPFVVYGASKSGTTWLQRILDAHPQVRCHFQRDILPLENRQRIFTPVKIVYDAKESPFGGVFSGDDQEKRYRLELGYIRGIDLLKSEYLKRNHPGLNTWERDLLSDFHQDLVRAMVEHILADNGEKTLFGTKVHTDLRLLFNVFPKARVVHITRDGRDVAVSRRFHGNRRGTFYYGDEASQLLRWLNAFGLGNRFVRWAQRRFGWFGPDWLQQPEDRASLLTPHSLAKFTLDWKLLSHYVIGFEQEFPDNFIRISYEDLLVDPHRHIAAVLTHIGASADPAIVDDLVEQTRFDKQKKKASGFFRKGQSGDWRNHFNDGDVALFKELAGDHLIELGYEKDMNWKL